jgi:hypothetical protein
MALWIVRWPGVGASIVTAESEEELELVLDEVADIEGCTWEPYDGPLWIDFTLRTSYSVRSSAAGAPPEEQDVLIESVDEMRSSSSPLKISVPIEDGSDTAAEFHDAVLGWAFPAVAKAYQEAADAWSAGGCQGDPSPPVADVLRAAVHADVAPSIVRQEAMLEGREARTDTLGRVAEMVGMPVPMIERMRARYLASRASQEFAPGGKTPPGPTKKRKGKKNGTTGPRDHPNHRNHRGPGTNPLASRHTPPRPRSL